MKEYNYIYEEGKLPNAFKGSELVMSLPHKHLEDILGSSKIREYEASEVLIKEGETSSWIFVLLAGKVEVTKKGEPIAAIERAGEIFGELAAINQTPRSASVTAAKPALCLAVDWSVVEKLDMKDEQDCCLLLYRFFMSVLSDRLTETTRKLAEAEAAIERLKSM